jgi:hypothetical protein
MALADTTCHRDLLMNWIPWFTTLIIGLIVLLIIIERH